MIAAKDRNEKKKERADAAAVLQRDRRRQQAAGGLQLADKPRGTQLFRFVPCFVSVVVGSSPIFVFKALISAVRILYLP